MHPSYPYLFSESTNAPPISLSLQRVNQCTPHILISSASQPMHPSYPYLFSESTNAPLISLSLQRVNQCTPHILISSARSSPQLGTEACVCFLGCLSSGQHEHVNLRDTLKTRWEALWRAVGGALDTPSGSLSTTSPDRVTWNPQGLWFVGCLTSQQHASVSQGRIRSDNFTLR